MITPVITPVLSLLFSFGNDLQTCKQLYENRPMQLAEAVACFETVAASALESSNTEVRFQALDAIALASVWNTVRGDTTSRRTAIDTGLKAASALITEFADTGSAHYWNAVYISQDAQERDRGATIPRNTLRVLGKIKSELKKAIALDPSVHGYGPDRVYGLLHHELPGLVGGDDTLAEKHLREAFTKAPRFSLNPVFLAKFYADEKKPELVRTTLLEITTTAPDQFDPTRVPETIDDRAEAERILARL